jgi:ribonuclease E
MPNTSHGGGISRKISNGADRKRLKSIMSDLNLPSVMGLIVRTAGLQRTKTEIKRDFDYLARLWDEIRERTLGSSAPALIYRDSDLIKRAIRDLYHREIEEVIVEGEEGYKAARGFMKLLMPSHVRRVQLHSESTPLFQRSGVEDQLNAMYQPVVQLKSGGYLVINPTEALVSIDINSGRSTREHNIEQTAFATNLEAATEIARQLRLRDMAGLIVIDFIDMEQSSHVRKVEKAMKEALKNDRARIQVGRISSFGLMEMSRQRLRTGVLEASTRPCQHCEGTGLMRTASSAGLSALRMIEDEAARGRGDRITLRAGREAAIYVLNKKRAELADMEQRYGVSVEVLIDESFEGARMAVESSGPRPVAIQRPQVTLAEEPEEDLDEDIADEDEEDTVEITLDESEERQADERGDDGERHGRKRRRRRRGGRGRSRRDGEFANETEGGTEAEPEQVEEPIAAEAEVQPGQQLAEPPAAETGRRRRRRGGKRAEAEAVETPVQPDSSPMVETPIEDEQPIAETEPVEEPKPKRRRSKKAAAAEAEVTIPEPAPPEAPPAETADQAAPPAKPARKRRSKAAETAPVAEPELAEAGAEPALVPVANNDAGPSDPPASPRRGWWQKTFG